MSTEGAMDPNYNTVHNTEMAPRTMMQDRTELNFRTTNNPMFAYADGHQETTTYVHYIL